MIVKSKRCVTLLEILVSLAILSTLLVLVFGFFRELSKVDELTRELQTKTFHMRYVESRLSYLFSNLVNEGDKLKRDFLFFLDPPSNLEEMSDFASLVFTYHNGVRLNPSFSGDIMARLYVNKNKQLCLINWPLPIYKNDVLEPNLEMQKEILLEQVEGIKFEFFTAPERPDVPPPPNNGANMPSPPKGTWVEEWPSIYKELPVILKMTILIENHLSSIEKKGDDNTTNQEKIIFTFPLPFAKANKNEQAIYYPL